MISINLYEIVWQIINFTLLVLILNKLLFRPLIRFIDKRAETIENDINEAKVSRDEALSMLEEQKSVTKQAYQEAKDIRNAAEQSAKTEQNKIISEAMESKNKIMARTELEVQSAYEKAKSSLIVEIGNLSSSLAERLMHRSIDAAEQEKVVNDFIKSSKELSNVK